MALNDLQRTRIRTYLGYPDRWLNYDSNIEWAMNLVDGYVQSEIEAVLAQLEEVDSALVTGLSVSGIKSAGQGDIEFFPGGKTVDISHTGKMLINRLAIKLGVECPRNYYGSEINIPSGLSTGFW
ncbi:MAG: hypothetical protein WC942_08890 [Clostridia bacterium]|jgi:hypothetical protein